MIEEEVSKAVGTEVKARIGEHICVPLEQQENDNRELLELLRRAIDNS
jgi:hypothetical protein